LSSPQPAATVCAVVVTYNRLELLRECLAALRAQTRPVDRVIVVDNASTDGTPDVVAREFPEFELLRLEQNTGGAGGFEAGMRRAHEAGHTWLWLMDDDTIPTPEALERLLGAVDRLAGTRPPAILASRALTAEGDLHPLNWVRPMTRSFPDFVEATSRGLMLMRYASFVSLMVHTDAVDRYGFPFGGYFIWNDDFEYTGRILQHEAGYYVPDSVVHHKSAVIDKNSVGERYYYEVRNKLLALRAGVFGPGERKETARMAAMVAAGIGSYLADNRMSGAAVKTVARGLRDGLTWSPDGHPPGRRST
jgi:GT2 family glycosyltransferase